MNKFFTRLAIGGSLVLALVLVIELAGCARDKPCKANITVLDTQTSAAIAGAVVKLTAPSPSTTTFSTTTDASGKASFEVNLPQILDIAVNNAPTGKVARFEQGKTDEVTVHYP
jgi:hypothetical protein